MFIEISVLLRDVCTSLYCTAQKQPNNSSTFLFWFNVFSVIYPACVHNFILLDSTGMT